MTAKDTTKKKVSILYSILKVLAIMAFTILISKFVIGSAVVSGKSMQPTLENHDRLIANWASYHFQDPERYDIVILKNGSENLVKRVVGLPGDTIQIKGGLLYCNGKLAKDDIYGKEMMLYGGIADTEITLQEEEYFVLGDNRNNSLDSRDKKVGIVKKDQILGQAILRIHPHPSVLK